MDYFTYSSRIVTIIVIASENQKIYRFYAIQKNKNHSVNLVEMTKEFNSLWNINYFKVQKIPVMQNSRVYIPSLNGSSW